jgi:cellulose synthase/poly-beta-1,6-N-acetylglucosamine synthase-like glycosyltransferase
MSPLDAVVLGIYSLTLAALAVYSVHRLYLVRLRRRHSATRETPAAPDRWPAVTIQLPLYNEPNVAARVIDAAAAIDYQGALDIQVLDDSTDETCAIVDERVEFHRARGVRIERIRRGSRDGFKAGALAHGMAISGAELFAVFDADFVPPRDFLVKTVPHFNDERVGMVQARWTHLNRDESLLTRVQAIFLDAHFAVESAARYFAGRFFNFNGTAGVWRRAAIEDAGGWSARTLTEDLDLSYRAQLAGWKFVFLPEVEVAAELPAALSGFQEQQHRWAKGSIQTARKLLPRIASSSEPRSTRSEAFFHLTNNSAYLLTTIVALLIVPAIVIRQRAGVRWTFAFDAILFLASTMSVLVFYIEGQRWAHRARPRWRELMAVLPVGIGISLRNSVAVLEGLFEQGGEFRRTPKRGAADAAPWERMPRVPWGELILATFFVSAAAAFVSARQWLSLPFLSLFLGGYLFIAVQALRERRALRCGSHAAPEPRRDARGRELDRPGADADRPRGAAPEWQALRLDARGVEVHRRERPRRLSLEAD